MITDNGTEITVGYTEHNTLHYYVHVYKNSPKGYVNFTNYFKTFKEATDSYRRECDYFSTIHKF